MKLAAASKLGPYEIVAPQEAKVRRMSRQLELSVLFTPPPTEG
jgi:hypothetical protein